MAGPPAWALKLAKAGKFVPLKKKKHAPAKAVAKKKHAPLKKEVDLTSKKKVSSSGSGAPAVKKLKGAGGRAVDKIAGSAGFASGLKVVGDYSTTLNQTNIGGGANNNKFYKIQVLTDSKGKYYTWNRWGRVGDDGDHKSEECASEEQAIKEFESKFRSKTGNKWSDRDSFKPLAGKYKIVETEEGKGGGDSAPVGKLTEAQISKGKKVLEKLKSVLSKSKKNTLELEKLSSDFYTMIPHNFGWKKPPTISSSDMLHAEMELLKFYLRMGFDKENDRADLSPINGVMELPVPKSLPDACTGICGRSDLKSSEDAGRKLAAKQAGRPKSKMEPHHYGSIMLYTSNAIYAALNKCLRDKNRASVKKYFKYLRLLLAALQTLPQQKRTLWRGMSVDLHDSPMYKVGNTVVWWGVSSCTSDKGVANNFAHGCGGGATVVTIQAKSACDISAISFYGSEKESLLPPGTKFKVKSKTRSKGITEITLEETGRALD